jgi:hypothetical protein
VSRGAAARLQAWLGCCLAASALALLLAASAAAAPGWTSSKAFPAPAGAFEGADAVRYQNGGTATEAFLEVPSISPLQTALHIGGLPPGGTYRDQLVVPTTGESIPLEAQIAVAPDGAAVAAWPELVGSNPETSPFRYRAAYRPTGGAPWEAPVTVASDSVRVKGLGEYLTVAIGGDGTAAVGVQHTAGETGKSQGEQVYRIDVAVHPAAGVWQPATRLSPEHESAEGPGLGLDGSGNVTAAYRLRFSEGPSPETSDDRLAVIVRRRPSSSGTWGPEENITGSEFTATAYAVQLGENEAGDAVVAYQYVTSGPTTADAWATTRAGASGAWSKPERLVHESSGSVPDAAGVSPDGSAFVLYTYRGGKSSGEDCAGVVVAAAAHGLFSPHQCVSPLNEEPSSGSLAFLGDDAYLAWRGNVPGESSNADVQASRWTAGAPRPDAAVNLDVAGVPYGSPRLVNDYEGSVVAFYTNHAGQLRDAAYDAGPPILLGADVPGTATAGQPVALSASFFDLWSGLGAGQPVWSFGDGTPAGEGAAVTHAFATSGVYTITLTAADALANAASTAFTIAVAPAAVHPPTALRRPVVALDQPPCPKRLSSRACKRRRGSVASWRRLTGSAVADPASGGIARVEVGVSVVRHGHLEAFLSGRFRRAPRAKALNAFVRAAVRGPRWSLQLPKLKPGTYTIRVRAIDRAGDVSPTLAKTVRLS